MIFILNLLQKIKFSFGHKHQHKPLIVSEMPKQPLRVYPKPLRTVLHCEPREPHEWTHTHRSSNLLPVYVRPSRVRVVEGRGCWWLKYFYCQQILWKSSCVFARVSVCFCHRRQTRRSHGQATGYMKLLWYLFIGLNIFLLKSFTEWWIWW